MRFHSHFVSLLLLALAIGRRYKHRTFNCKSQKYHFTRARSRHIFCYWIFLFVCKRCATASRHRLPLSVAWLPFHIFLRCFFRCCDVEAATTTCALVLVFHFSVAFCWQPVICFVHFKSRGVRRVRESESKMAMRRYRCLLIRVIVVTLGKLNRKG